MLSLSSPQIVQQTALKWKQEGKKIAFVPTMGALHEGHLALVKHAHTMAEKVIVSIFVNPLQFGKNEDFNKYPRTLAADEEKLKSLPVDLLFAPSNAELYPEGFITRIALPELSSNLCGKSRPGHFDGVATVCLKLFQIAQPDFVILGEKDFQQVRVLQQLVNDLNLPLTLIMHPTMREDHGLALSSRNRYLSPEEKALALKIPVAIENARKDLRTVRDVLQTVSKELEVPGIRFDYCEVCSEKDLIPCPPHTPLSEISHPRLFIAVWIGNTRLIDNTSLTPLMP